MWALKLNKPEWLHMFIGSVSAIGTGLVLPRRRSWANTRRPGVARARSPAG